MACSIKIKSLSKSYTAGKTVLNGINLDINPGELFFLLGPSGCGKSTLLRIIAGLIKSDKGEIYFDDQRIDQLPPEERRSTMVFQNYALWPHLNVYENIEFSLKARKLSAAIRQEKVEEVLSLVQLTDFADRKINTLSGGQQQRTALARALAADPRVLLLDEPLSNLDAALRDRMRIELRDLCKKRNLTAIFVTHDRKEALSMADRISVLDKGILQQTATPKELYQRPKNAFVGTFLGDANIFEAKIIGIENENAILATPFGKLTVKKLPTCKLHSIHRCLMRPEAFEPNSGNNNSPKYHQVECNLIKSCFTGEIEIRTWKLANGFEFCQNVPGGLASTPDNSNGRLEFSTDNVVILEDM